MYVSPNQLTSFLPSKSQSKALYLCWYIALKIIGIFWCSGSLMDQKCQKMLLVLICQDFQTHISSPPLASFFQQVVNRNPFTWGGLFVFKYHEENSLRRNWSPGWPNVSKVFSVLGYLDIPTRPPRQLHIWILASRSEYRDIFSNVPWKEHFLIVSLRLESWWFENAKRSI